MLELKSGNLLENLWDPAKAAGMSEPELLLYRSNLLGADKRITNYGGGNTSAKVMETDPLTGESVEVLWVKGSGGDVGTIRLDGFATLYMSKLEALKGLYRGVEHRGRDGGLPAPLHLRPQPARRLDRHAAARLRAARPRRPHARRRDHRHRRLEGLEGADAGDLRRRDRLAALEAPGLRARPLARAVLPRQPEREGRGARKPRPLHLGRRRAELLRHHDRRHQPRHRVARRAHRGQAGLRRRRGTGRSSPASGARSPRR